MINTKISESKKFEKDGQWFKDFMNHYIPFQLPYHEDYEVMLNSYKVVNNDLSGYREQLEAFCNPLGLSVGEIEETVLPYPELRNKVNILKGEMLTRKDTFHIMLLSSKAIKEKNEQLLNAIKESVDEKTAIDISKMEMEMQGMSQEEIQKFTQELRTKNEPEDLLVKDFMSESEIFYNKAIKFCEYNQDIQDKKSQTFEDVIATDRCFIYSGWKHGKPYLEIRNPLTVGFHKNPNERYIQHSDWVWYTKAITVTEAQECYNLTEDEVMSFWSDPKLYQKLTPNPDAVKIINELAAQGHNIVFLSMCKKGHFASKVQSSKEWFNIPQEQYGFIVTHEKHFADVDVIIDDRNKFLESFKYKPEVIKIKIKTPFTQDADLSVSLDLETSDWNKIGEFINDLH